MKRLEQALVVKQVSQNIKSFLYLNYLYQPNQLLSSIGIFDLFSRLVFEMIRTYLTQTDPRGWLLVHFCISFAKKVNQIAQISFDILAAVYF